MTTDPTADPRTQLLHALDFSACLNAGYSTPEELLAAYDTSRTQLPADRAAVTPPPALTTEGRLRARVQILEEDVERNQGLAKVGARCMREGHQGLIESGRATVEGHRFALSVALGLGTGAPWDAIHERVAELCRMADETPAAQPDTLPAWLYQRFMPDGTGWDSLDDGQRSHWEHQAHAVRRAVARGGFKQPAAGAESTALDVLRCLADPEPCRWEGVYCVTHSWRSDIGRCPHGQAQALISGGTATEVLPRRGDQFEAWLKAQRDSFGWQGSNDRRLYDALDGILDRYRLHADTGTPLDEHVCEGQAVGDCECLEQPAVSPPPA